LAVASLALSASGAVSLTAEEQEVADRLVGDPGQRRSRREMTLDPILTAVARARAEDMAKRRYFDHVDPDGIGPNCHIQRAGYGVPAFWGRGRSENFIESIGAGYMKPAEVWYGLLHSPTHRKHLLASDSFYRNQTSFGIGLYSDPSSPHRRYWVIITAPPSLRGKARFVSHRLTKPAPVAVSIPVRGKVEAEESGARSVKTAPRILPARAVPAVRLWHWDGPLATPRPRS